MSIKKKIFKKILKYTIQEALKRSTKVNTNQPMSPKVKMINSILKMLKK